MAGPILTVEQAAEQLGLHPKTVLRYIREGRLDATRVGKSYRIPRAALEALAGLTIGADEPDAGVRTTCITDMAEMTVDAAERLATFLQSAALTGDARTPPLHLQTIFDPRVGALKIVMIGEPGDVGRLLEMMQLHMKARR